MSDRRYDDEEAAAIFLTAAENPRAAPLHAPRNEGLTLADLQDIGREVGISPEAVAQAAQSLELRRQAVTRSFLGLPIGVERTVALNRWLTDAEWDQLVVQLRETFRARGTVKSYGSLRQWTNGNLQALLEPTANGHRLRLGTVKGDARTAMASGLAIVGVAGAVAISSSLGGHLHAAVSGIALLAIAGIGIFANGAFRVSSWARLRGQQMESIAARLASPSTSSLDEPEPQP
jgi:hypothetical protein